MTTTIPALSGVIALAIMCSPCATPLRPTPSPMPATTSPGMALTTQPKAMLLRVSRPTAWAATAPPPCTSPCATAPPAPTSIPWSKTSCRAPSTVPSSTAPSTTRPSPSPMPLAATAPSTTRSTSGPMSFPTLPTPSAMTCYPTPGTVSRSAVRQPKTHCWPPPTAPTVPSL